MGEKDKTRKRSRTPLAGFSSAKLFQKGCRQRSVYLRPRLLICIFQQEGDKFKKGPDPAIISLIVQMDPVAQENIRV
jgi:hypothetical protein